MLQVSCAVFIALVASTLGDYPLPDQHFDYVPQYTYGVPEKDEIIYKTPEIPTVPFTTYEAPHKPAIVHDVPVVPKKPVAVYGVPVVPKKPVAVYGVPYVAKKPVEVYGVPEIYETHPIVHQIPTVVYEAPKVYRPIVSHYKYDLPEQHVHEAHPVEVPVHYNYYPKPAEVYGVPHF